MYKESITSTVIHFICNIRCRFKDINPDLGYIDKIMDYYILIGFYWAMMVKTHSYLPKQPL